MAVSCPATGSSPIPHLYLAPTEQRALCNLPRKAGKAPPPRLTSTQRKVIGTLIDKHGEDSVHVSTVAVGREWGPCGNLRAWAPVQTGVGAGQELLIIWCMDSFQASGLHWARG